MSVNIYDGTNLTPIAGKTVPAPTPDYVDAQYNSSTTYSKGMTCISGNVRYRYKNSTASSGHQPPNATYWEVLSVSDELNNVSYTTDGLTLNNDDFEYVAFGYAKIGKLIIITGRVKAKKAYSSMASGGLVCSGLPAVGLVGAPLNYAIVNSIEPATKTNNVYIANTSNTQARLQIAGDGYNADQILLISCAYVCV